MATKKTALNSAYRRALNDRQDNRRYMMIGFVLAILLILPILFGNEESNPEPQALPGEVGVVAEIKEELRAHPLARYAAGESIEEMDAKLESMVNASGR